MKKHTLTVSLIALVMLISMLSGCDNRTQLEKDRDAAAAKMNNALR